MRRGSLRYRFARLLAPRKHTPSVVGWHRRLESAGAGITVSTLVRHCRNKLFVQLIEHAPDSDVAVSKLRNKRYCYWLLVEKEGWRSQSARTCHALLYINTASFS